MAACASALATALLSPAATLADGGVDKHRLYNPNSGEHFYTASRVERDRLRSVGWSDERVAWEAPDSGEDVYRVYNPNGGDHHYTTSAGEHNLLVAAGWSDEGVGWYASSAGSNAEQSNYLAGADWLIELPEYWRGKLSIYTGIYTRASPLRWGRLLADELWVYADDVDEPKMLLLIVRRHAPGKIKPPSGHR